MARSILRKRRGYPHNARPKYPPLQALAPRTDPVIASGSHSCAVTPARYIATTPEEKPKVSRVVAMEAIANKEVTNTPLDCPECGTPIVHSCGCVSCPACGWGRCG